MSNREIAKLYSESVTKKRFETISSRFDENYVIQYRKSNETDFTTTEISDTQFQTIKRHIDTSDEAVATARKILSGASFSDGQINEVLSIVLRYDNPGKFFSMLQNKLTLDEFLEHPNDIVYYIAQKYGLDTRLVIDLLRFEPATKPSTGKGEPFMMIFIQGASKQGGAGDVNVNGTGFEVKGYNARLKGQKGFAGGDEIRKQWVSECTKLVNKAKIDIKIPNNTEFNIIKNSTGFLDSINEYLIQSGKITRMDILNAYVNVFNTMYPNHSGKPGLSVTNWIDTCLDDHGRMIHGEFMKHYFIYAVQYYTHIEDDFDYLLSIYTATGTAKSRMSWSFGKFNYISRQEIFNNPEAILDTFTMDSPPSFSPSAGPQGAAWALGPVVTAAQKGEIQSWV